MQVGLWGSYNHGNFGDDVMAIVFAQMIATLGHTPVIFRLNADLAHQYAFKTTESLDEFVDISDIIVIGGGGMWTRPNWRGAVFSPYVIRGEFDYLRLSIVLKRQKKEIVPVSIGSDGMRSADALSPFRRQLFAGPSCKVASVRLPDDVRVASDLDIDATFIPDIVFALPTWFKNDLTPRESGPRRIGVNLSKIRGKSTIENLYRYQSENKNIIMRFYTSHSDSRRSSYEYIPKNLNENVELHRYRTPASLINSLGDLDLMISSKLHIGVAAMAYGVPFISIGGKGKTRAQMHLLGLDDYTLDANNTTVMLNLVDQVLKDRQIFAMQEVMRSATQAVEHQSFLSSTLMSRSA